MTRTQTLLVVVFLAAAVAISGCAAPPAKARATQGNGWIELFNGKDLSGWKARHEGHRNGWYAYQGAMYNHPPSIDIYTDQKFDDFELHVEFMVPPGGNSGVYLRGRYEVQVKDSLGRPPDNDACGAIYGQVAPSENAAERAGTWQTFDVTLIGKTVTVIHNGKKVVDKAELGGATGGAMDGNVGQPGPIMLQGDHGPIAYRNIKLRPIRKGCASCPPCLPGGVRGLSCRLQGYLRSGRLQEEVTGAASWASRSLGGACRYASG